MRVYRTYARVYGRDMDALLDRLAAATGELVSGRFALAGAGAEGTGVEVATVGRVLVVAGQDEALEPYRSTSATLIVDDLDAFAARLADLGARIVRGPQTVPTGRNLTAEPTAGVRVEYVEWNEAQWQRVGGRPD